MVDLASVQGAISSLKMAGDIAKSFVGLKTQAEINARVVDLQGVILDAQSSLFAANDAQRELVSQVESLKTQIAANDRWEQERLRYRLYTPSPGLMFYALIASRSNGEPAHYLCTNCFQTGRKSILNQGKNAQAWTQFICPVCPVVILTNNRASFPIQYAPEI